MLKRVNSMEHLLELCYAKPDQTIKEHNQNLFQCIDVLDELGYIKNKHLRELLEISAQYHDIGKVNEKFQYRVKNNDKRIKFDEEKEVAHNILSMFFLDPNMFEEELDYLYVLYAIGFHHNYESVFESVRTKRELIKCLLQPFETVKLKRSKIEQLKGIRDDVDAILIKGLLHRCDYSASANARVEYPNDFMIDSLKHLCDRWRKRPEFHGWNEMQMYCLEHSEENIMVLADTGMGKTEASLLWAGDNKLFYILPVRTALNAMYDRFKRELLQKENIEQRLGLLHSEALEYVLGKDEGEMDVLEHYKVVKNMSLPVTITTMDQLFDFVFKYSGYEYKLATFSYSRLIIDEIQMYNADLLAYIVVGIKQIYKMGGKISIVTATLYPFIVEYFDEIPFLKASFEKSEKPRHNVKIIESGISSQDVVKKYWENKEKGKSNKILVICNTVKKVQEIYEQIVSGLKEENSHVKILHGRFTKEERAKKEKEILKTGKTYKEDSYELNFMDEIWVTTSLVEASLDIDFDYLFTELQDLASLLQRLGRCNRKGLKNIDETNCFVYTEIKPSLLDKSKGFIDRAIYELSKEAILQDNELRFDGIVTEQQKKEIINKYFTTEKLEAKKSRFHERFIEVCNMLECIEHDSYNKGEIKLRDILSEEIIPSPVYLDNKEEIFKNLKKLQSEKLSLVDKIIVEEQIKKYTVSVPKYIYLEYEKSKRRGQALYFEEVKVSKYHCIPVVECIYSDKGVEQINFQNRYVDPVFW